MKRILFFSPYSLWQPHLLWEVTMAYALRQRGHTVHFVGCNGLSDCGMEPRRTGRRDESVCAQCRQVTWLMPQTFRLPASFLQDVLSAEEQQELQEWAAGVPAETLPATQLEGLPLGEWIWPDMVSYWHTLEPDLSRPEVVATYRNYLYGVALAVRALPRVFDRFAPDVLVTLNGTFFLHRVAVETARARGIRYVTHERGWMDNTIVLNANEMVNDMEQYRYQWASWKDVPLTYTELQAVEKLLIQRRRGRNMNWVAYSPSPQDLQAVREAMRLPDQPIALLCTSSDCEGSIYDRERTVRQIDWIRHTVEWFRAHPEYTLVIRVHPNEAEHARVDDRNLQQLRALKGPELPVNVRLILPEEPISTYSLMDMASVGLVYGSTAGLEMACEGIPVVHAGIGIYKNAGFTHEITDLAQIPDTMARVMVLPRDPEIKRMAYRFVYRIFYGLCVPVRGVKVGRDFCSAQLSYESTAELAPGRDADLDRIAAYILGEGELYPPPSPEQRNVVPEQEDRFFAEQRVATLLVAVRQQPERADLREEALQLLQQLGMEKEATTLLNERPVAA